MNRLFTLILAAACFTASAQSDIDYPYNPDFENDGFVGIEDVLELLSVYGAPFTPEQLLLDGASFTEIIESLQTQIDSLASFTNEGFGALVLNDSLLTEYLVGVAAASEEGDSTLAAWVVQLSEVVEQQQAQIDSLLEDEIFPFNEAGQLAFGSREVWQVPIEVSYISDWGYPLVTHYSPGEDGFMITPQNAICSFNGFNAFIVPSSFQHETSTWQELLDAMVTYYDYYSDIGLIPIGADEKLLIQLEEDETDCFPQEFVWLPITQTVGDVVGADVQTLQEVVAAQQSEIDSMSTMIDLLLEFVEYSGCGNQESVNYLGHDYELVDLVDQCWFAENLAVTQFSNGDPIEFLGTDPGALIANNGTGIGGYTYPNGDASLASLGLLYNGYVAIDERNICPTGFRLPTSSELEGLAEKVMDNPLGFLDELDWHGTNESGFSAVPTGRFENDFINVGTHLFLYGTEGAGEYITAATIADYNGEEEGQTTAGAWDPWLSEQYNSGKVFFSIRCIKD